MVCRSAFFLEGEEYWSGTVCDAVFRFDGDFFLEDGDICCCAGALVAFLEISILPSTDCSMSDRRFDFFFPGVSWVAALSSSSGQTVRRRLGHAEPQLTDFFNDRSTDCGRGEEDAISWAKRGFLWLEGLASVPLEEKRVHMSEAGSAWGVLEVRATLLRATCGVVNLAAGDEAGEELFARLLPFFETMGEGGISSGNPDLHSTLSFGDFSASSSSEVASGTLNSSFHDGRSAGVLALLNSSSFESGDGLFRGIDLVKSMFSLWSSSVVAAFADFDGLEAVSSDRKVWSLFLVDSETGASDCRGPLLAALLAAGLLLVLDHPPRYGCHMLVKDV